MDSIHLRTAVNNETKRDLLIERGGLSTIIRPTADIQDTTRPRLSHVLHKKQHMGSGRPTFGFTVAGSWENSWDDISRQVRIGLNYYKRIGDAKES